MSPFVTIHHLTIALGDAGWIQVPQKGLDPLFAQLAVGSFIAWSDLLQRVFCKSQRVSANKSNGPVA